MDVDEYIRKSSVILFVKIEIEIGSSSYYWVENKALYLLQNSFFGKAAGAEVDDELLKKNLVTL